MAFVILGSDEINDELSRPGFVHHLRGRYPGRRVARASDCDRAGCVFWNTWNKRTRSICSNGDEPDARTPETQGFQGPLGSPFRTR